MPVPPPRHRDDVPISTDVRLALDARVHLGESALWDDRSDVLVWVDIVAGHLHRFDPGTGRDEHREIGQPVGSAGLRGVDGYVLAVRDGFGVLDSWDAAPRLIAPVEIERTDARMNDGAVDPAGRFWAGTAPLAPEAQLGSLYRLDRDGSVTRALTGVRMANGIDWSADGRTMYYVDSETQRLDAIEVHPATGTLGTRRPLVEIPAEEGIPDGLTVDAEGFIWVAMWGGWAVHRYDPAGRLDRIVRFPASNMTRPAFGGAELTELFVTSATEHLDADDLRIQPTAGGIFVCRPGVRGRPANRFLG